MSLSDADTASTGRPSPPPPDLIDLIEDFEDPPMMESTRHHEEDTVDDEDYVKPRARKTRARATTTARQRKPRACKEATSARTRKIKTEDPDQY